MLLLADTETEIRRLNGMDATGDPAGLMHCYTEIAKAIEIWCPWPPELHGWARTLFERCIAGYQRAKVRDTTPAEAN